MGLRTKFNLAVLAAFLVGFGAAAYVLQQEFVADARDVVIGDARLMMTAANAVRHLTSTQIEPIADQLNSSKFIAASVPSFSAQLTFKDVQANFPDFTYHEPALNPTNPADRATDWEADFINTFRNSPSTKELIAERDTPTGRSLSLARPIEVGGEDCLTCHSTVARAPGPMLATYGTANGFGWKLHEIVGAQVVSVPMEVALAKARHEFIIFMGILVAMLVLILIVLNVLLDIVVIRPVVKVARIANAVSLGEVGVEEYEKKGSDEISVLSAAFNRMRRSLDSAMKMLDP